MRENDKRRKTESLRIIHRSAKPRNWAVIGAGGGGLALAAYLALKNQNVRLYNRSAGKLHPVQRTGGLQVHGLIQGFAPVQLATTSIEKALDGVDIVMVVVPANAHAAVARLCASQLADGQLIVLNPGRTGGALEFAQVLKSNGNTARITITEAQTFLFASRLSGPGEVTIHGKKRHVPIAALPAVKTRAAVRRMNDVIPEFIPAENVLETSLMNIGAIFHPAPTLLNASRIEQGTRAFEYYRDGSSRSVAALLSRLDNERINVARVLGLELPSAYSWIKDAYAVKAPGLYEALQHNPAYRGVLAPNNLVHRYITEDVPTGLVPIASLGHYFGVRTPLTNSLINIANALHGVNYWEHGRTVESLGIRGMTSEELWSYVSTGFHTKVMDDTQTSEAEVTAGG